MNDNDLEYKPDYGDWKYNEEVGLYFFKGEGIGYTWQEIEELENSVEEQEEQKRRRKAEANEH